MITLEDIKHLPFIPHTKEYRTRPFTVFEEAEVVWDLESSSHHTWRIYVAGRGNTDFVSQHLPVPSGEHTIILSREINPDRTLKEPLEFLLLNFISYRSIPQS